MRKSPLVPLYERGRHADKIGKPLPFLKGEREGFMLPYNKNLKQYARQLRENMTDAERKLWAKIRRKQIENIY